MAPGKQHRMVKLRGWPQLESVPSLRMRGGEGRRKSTVIQIVSLNREAEGYRCTRRDLFKAEDRDYKLLAPYLPLRNPSSGASP